MFDITGGARVAAGEVVNVYYLRLQKVMDLRTYVNYLNQILLKLHLYTT